MTDYCWSDLHIGHANILAFTGRSYVDLDHMLEGLVERCNSVVTPDDTLWMLGDMCMGKIVDSLPKLSRFNGHKKLILGNHDRPFPAGHGGKAPNKKAEEWREKYLEYFDDIYLNKVLDIGGHQVLFNHFPLTGDSHDDDRYEDFRVPEWTGWRVHGHTHQKEIVGHIPKHIHVGVDALHHPMSFEQIAEIIEGEDG